MDINWRAKRYTNCKIRIDPEKILQYPQLSKIKKQVTKLFPDTQKLNENRYLFTDPKTGGMISSLFREYEVWSHIYQLSRKESFAAPFSPGSPTFEGPW
jgi:hypothetical protein